jgi:hypothetical protein
MHQETVNQIIEQLGICTDVDLLDLILKLLLESSY